MTVVEPGRQETKYARRFLRVGLDGAGLSCVVWRDGVDGSGPVKGQLMVLGEGGAFVEIKGRFGIGDTLGLSLELPGNEKDPFVCQGIVRECLEEEGIGVEFTELDGHALDRLRTAVLRWAMKP